MHAQDCYEPRERDRDECREVLSVHYIFLVTAQPSLEKRKVQLQVLHQRWYAVVVGELLVATKRKRPDARPISYSRNRDLLGLAREIEEMQDLSTVNQEWRRHQRSVITWRLHGTLGSVQACMKERVCGRSSIRRWVPAGSFILVLAHACTGLLWAKRER